MVATVFSAQDLGLGMIESNCHVDIGAVLARFSLNFDVRLKYRWRGSFHADRVDAYGKLLYCDGFLKHLLGLPRIIISQFVDSINDDLRCVWSTQSKNADIITLPLGEEV